MKYKTMNKGGAWYNIFGNSSSSSANNSSQSGYKHESQHRAIIDDEYLDQLEKHLSDLDQREQKLEKEVEQLKRQQSYSQPQYYQRPRQEQRPRSFSEPPFLQQRSYSESQYPVPQYTQNDEVYEKYVKVIDMINDTIRNNNYYPRNIDRQMNLGMLKILLPDENNSIDNITNEDAKTDILFRLIPKMKRLESYQQIEKVLKIQKNKNPRSDRFDKLSKEEFNAIINTRGGKRKRGSIHKKHTHKKRIVKRRSMKSRRMGR
jgi:hypothetical protein